MSFTATHNPIHRHPHKHSHLRLVFGEKLWKRQLWRDGDRHAGFSGCWFGANSAHRLHRWSSAGLTDTDGNLLLICLVSGLTTNIQCTEHQVSLCLHFHFLFWLHYWILQGLVKEYITSLLLCNACIVFQTAKTGVSGVWPMSIPGFLRSCRRRRRFRLRLM